MNLIHDPMANRFRYTPQGAKEKFAEHFPRLKYWLNNRFGQNIRFDEGSTIYWDAERKDVVITFPPDTPDILLESVHNYIFGFFEGLGF